MTLPALWSMNALADEAVKHSFESGKRWIPFYFGGDARRMEVLYKGEGCLTFTGGGIWGQGGGDLVEIRFDPSGSCYDS